MASLIINLSLINKNSHLGKCYCNRMVKNYSRKVLNSMVKLNNDKSKEIKTLWKK